MSQADSNTGARAGAKNSQQTAVVQNLKEDSLQRMEALVRQSAKGINVLFDNASIAQALSRTPDTGDTADFLDFQKMKRMQEVMTQLIDQKTLIEKLAFLNDLDRESYELLIRTYFHLVEGTVRASTDTHH